MNRNYVYVFPTPYQTFNVVNYSGKSEVNSFLHLFDIWGSRGHQKMCSDGNHSAFWFECNENFYKMLQTEEFTRAFKSMGVVLTFDAKDIVHID